jgi:kumamolisin
MFADVSASGSLRLDSRAAQLAVPLSIAVRIEPELIRAIRLAVLPHLDVSAESDLWFDDGLVASRGPDAIVLRPEVLPVLRARLADRLDRGGTDDPIRSVWNITSQVHAWASPALVLEEKVAWLAARGGDECRAVIDDELRGALHALRDEGRTGIADWLVGAWPRLPESVRDTKLAWQLRQAASVHTDTSGLPLGVVPAGFGVADLADFAADVPDVWVAVRLTGGQLEIGDIGATPGAALIPLLDTDPAIVELLPSESAARGTAIAVPRGGAVSVPAGSGPASLLTPRGLVYQVSPYTPRVNLMPLPGSERQPLASAQPAGELDLSAEVTITLVLRRRTELPSPVSGGLSAEELVQRYGASPDDVDLVQRSLRGFGLTVTEVHLGSRRMLVSGALLDLATAFGTSLRQVSTDNPEGSGSVIHRYRKGPLMIPAELDGVVTAVLGLDNRPQAEPCLRLGSGPSYPQADDSRGGEPLTPLQVASCYEFPTGTDGAGQRLAVIELGTRYAVLPPDQYFSGLGIRTPQVRVVGSADGATLMPVSHAVSGALAPAAEHLVYFSPNTDRGFVDTLSTAIHASPAPTAISIGWGDSEDAWTPQARVAVNQVLADAAALGITVCAAAGDGGSESGQRDSQSHVYFPASSPYALACAGTSLSIDVSSAQIVSEVVWRSTGGGISDVFALPSWQAEAVLTVHAEGGQPGRGVPDVAANADPATGYLVLMDNQTGVVGGTAMAAALWAALVCLFAQATGRSLGHLQPILYQGASPRETAPCFRSITSGNNGAYQAGPGWDACTGLGSPVGTVLLRLLSGSSYER